VGAAAGAKGICTACLTWHALATGTSASPSTITRSTTSTSSATITIRGTGFQASAKLGLTPAGGVTITGSTTFTVH